MKRFKILLFVSILLFSNSTRNVYAACTGSGSSSYTWYTTSTSYAGLCSCVSHTGATSGSCTYLLGVCSWCRNGGQTCTGGYSGCTIGYVCPGGSGCGTGYCQDLGGCTSCTSNCSCASNTCVGSTCRNSCNDGDCDGTLTQTAGTWGSCVNCIRQCTRGRCDGACPGIPATCVVNGSFSDWSPNDCSPLCGQTVTRTCDGAACGGTCSDAEGSITSKVCSNNDNGNPNTTTVVSPNGDQANPTVFVTTTPTLTWNQNSSSLTDGYNVEVYSVSTGTRIFDYNVGGRGSTSKITGVLSPGVYYWRIRAYNTTCGTDNGPWSSNYYFRINSAPTIVRIQVANSDITVVPNDNTIDNHICKSEFTGTTKPKEVVFGIFVNDVDGIGDSGSPPILHWNGQNYPSAWTGTGGGNNAAQVRVDYVNYVGASPQSLHDVTATYSDRWGSAATNNDPNLPTTRLRWKVWDCQVPVSGTLYSATDAVQNCSTSGAGNGFSVPIDSVVGFESMVFSDTPDVSMSDDNLANYGTNSIVWGKTYLPLINGGSVGDIDGTLLATGRVTRVIDLGAGTTTCPGTSAVTIGSNNLSPYSASPMAKIDFSFIRDQEGWYQVIGAGVKSKSDLEYGVPVTAPVSSRSLTLGNLTSDNGLVSGISFTNINGNSNDEFGFPNNWWVSRNTNDLDSYNYNYFYNNFLVKARVGVTGTDWGDKPANGIYFVKNDLSIDSNFTLADPDLRTMMVIVNGNINIAANVTLLDGIYMADGNISAGGVSVDQLNINGMLYAGGSVRLNRSFTDKTENNTTPAVKINYSPGLIFNLDPGVLRVLSGWREE